MSEEELDNVRTAVSEAATNSVLHAYKSPDGRGRVRMEAKLDARELLVCVRDFGVGISGRPAGTRKGVGLHVIATLTDSFEMRRCPGGGTEVRMRFVRRRPGG